MGFKSSFLKQLPAIFILAGFLSQATSAWATTYYAAPNGSGTSCTIESPCALNSGLGKLVAGDTLYLREGTYNQLVSFSKNGTSESRITISGYSGETAIIDGYYSIPSGCYDFLVTIHGSYVTFRDIRVQNSYGSGIATGGATTGVQFINVILDYTGETGLVLGGSHNLADHVTVTRNGQRYGSGCGTWGSALCTVGSDNTIQNSLTYDNRGEGLNAYSSSRNSIIQDNVSYNNRAVGLYLDSSSGATVRRNLVYYSPGWNLSSARCLTIGAETGQASNLTIVNNLLMGGFVNLETDSNLTQLTNVTIAHNTFVNARGDLSSGYNMGVYFRSNLSTFINSVFKNNIVVEEASGRVPIFVPSSHPGLAFSHNNWNKAPLVSAQGTGDVIADPKLAKTGFTGPGQLTGKYFMIPSDSPACDRGQVIGSVSDDFFGKERPVGIYPDIGGYEYRGETESDLMKQPANLRILN
jgi:parallel beta-helix repeat protein